MAGKIVLGPNQYGKAEVPAGARSTAATTERHVIARPQRDDPAARRLRGLPHRGRQQPGGRDRHPEEHRLRLRPRARRRLAGGLPAPPRAALHRRVRRGSPAAAGRRSSTRGSASRPTATTRSCARGRETRTAVVEMDGDQITVTAGLKDCTVLKSTGSRVPRLPARPLHDAAGDDRPDPGDQRHRDLAATPARDLDYNATVRRRPRPAADDLRRHPLLALQQTIFEMGKAVLEAVRRGRARSACPARTSTTSSSTSSPSASTTRARSSSRPTVPTG